MGRTQLFGNALFNRDRFSASESGVDFMTLSSDPAFTNCYAMCADLKEKATGARVKVVSVNVTTTNGIENASGTVAQGFDTLFAKLNAMKDDHVIVFFQGMDQKRYNYIKARAASSLQSPYALVGKVESWDVYQCSYATANRSATAARVAKIPFVKSNLAASYSQNPQALQAKVVFDELPDDGFADTFVESDYARSMDVTFTGYSGSTLANFPVLVRLSTAINGFRYSDFRLPNGGDLRFTDASGNVLPHEIDTWNPSGESTVWVKVPSLQANAKIVAHYRCTRPVRVDSAQVWDSNYVGVWHLGESALPLKESCGVSVDFTHSSGETVGYGAQGIVGGSVDFANGPSNAVVALDHDALDGFSRFTIEAWTKQSAHKSNAGILSKRETYQNNVAYYMYDGNGPTVLNVGTNNNCNPIQASNAIRPTAGAWAHQAYTVDMKASVSNVWGYLNGESTAPKSVDFVVTVVSNRIGNLTLGNLNANAKDNSFNGLIDEVRISKSVRSAAWIKATHDTVAIADFATYEVAIPEVPTAFASDSAGFDYTNRVVTVTNATAGATLTLTATAPGGTTTTATATVNENGEATFDIPTAPGEAYSYEVAMDGDIIASGGFFTGGWGEEAEWFSASARTGASEVSGGVWKNTPTVANGKYAVDGTADFVLSSEAVAAGLNRFVRIDFDYSFDAICDESELADGDSKLIGGFTAAANSTSAGFWMAYGTDGWIPLYGDVAPEEAREYVVRAEVDTSAVPPQTSYAVRADGGDAFSPLFVDEARTARWVAGAVQSEAVTGVEFDGQGSVASVCGSLANANIAEADGVGYASLADAIASATNSLVLLTNATWPTNTPVGTVSVDRGDFALAGVTLDGDGNVVVPSGFSSIPNVGKINITLEQAASLGVATAGKSPAQIAEALAANGDNGIPRWESYVLGLDPTKPDAKPKATIVMNGENVELALVGIDVNEDAGATVTYRVYKFSDLANIEEEPVGGDLAPGATAEIPKDATEPKMFYRLKIDVKGY
jgi:hypothetical protein